MIRRTVSKYAVFMVAAVMLLSIAAKPLKVSAFAGGAGTVEAPYQISTCEQLQAMGADETARGAHYELVGNIDCSATSISDTGNVNYDANLYNDGHGFIPVGDYGAEFNGTFNGNGFVISNLTSNRPLQDHIGLFGYASNAVIEKVGLVNVAITGQRYAGGVVGVMDNANSYVRNVYVTGSITLLLNESVTGSGQYAGGITSGMQAGAHIVDSYSTASVTTAYPGSGDGGIIGFNYDSFVSSTFWDAEVSGISNSAAGTSKTTAEMKTESTFATAGWDLAAVWGFNAGGYPYLRTADVGGNGTSEHPYQISDCTQLQAINAASSADKYYALDKDIDCSDSVNWNEGAGFTPIGFDGDTFKGDFDGGGFTISDLSISRSGYDDIGLFAALEGATVHDFTITGTITGESYVGAVAGVMSYSNAASRISTVRDVTSSAVVVGSDNFTGGVVGRSDGNESDYNAIFNNHTSGAVNGYSATGGIVGDTSYTDVYHNYSTGAVDSEWSDGGGIIGASGRSAVFENASTSNITVGTVNAGGLIGGSFQDTVYDNFARGNATASERRAGGLIGLMIQTSVANSYATGEATAQQDAGGLVGIFQFYEDTGHSTISNTFSAGSAYSSGETPDSVNGFVGKIEHDTWGADDFTNNFFNRDNNNECAVAPGGAAVEYDQCQGVYLGQQPARFQVESETPFTLASTPTWNFTDTWKVQKNDYPCLINLVASCNESVVPHDAASLTSDQDGTLVGMEMTGCSKIDSFTSLKESTLTQQDVGFDYPSGLLNFQLSGCPVRGTATVSLSFFGTYDPNKVVVRKYNATTKTFTTLSNSYEDMSVAMTTVEGQPAYRITYNINDGSSLDQDGVADGTIVDPIGIAASVIAVPNTGLSRR